MELLFILLGLIVGIVGTMAGVGGGFILLPILLAIYKDKPHENIIAITMTVIMINAIFGVISYSRQGKADYRAGIIFSIASIPSAALGAYLTAYLPDIVFKIVLGIFMVFGAYFMIFGKTMKSKEVNYNENSMFLLKGSYNSLNGEITWRYDSRIGFLVSAIAGFLASIMGIGGGIFHVPTMIKILRFPVKVAVATSQFIIVFMSISSVITHFFSGNLDGEIKTILLIALGTAPGTYIGVYLASRINGKWIVRILATIMVLVALRTIYTAL